MSIRSVKVDNGKYEIRFNEQTGDLSIFRHGELWSLDKGNKFVLSVLHRIEELQEREEALTKKLDEAIGLLDECTDAMDDVHLGGTALYNEATDFVWNHNKQR